MDLNARSYAIHGNNIFMVWNYFDFFFSNQITLVQSSLLKVEKQRTEHRCCTIILGVSTQDMSHQRLGEGPTDVVQVSWGLYPGYESPETGEGPTDVVQMSLGLYPGYEPPEMRRRTYRCCTIVLGSLPGIWDTREGEKNPQMLYKCYGVSTRKMSHQRWGEGPTDVLQMYWGLFPRYTCISHQRWG